MNHIPRPKKPTREQLRREAEQRDIDSEARSHREFWKEATGPQGPSPIDPRYRRRGVR